MNRKSFLSTLLSATILFSCSKNKDLIHKPVKDESIHGGRFSVNGEDDACKENRTFLFTGITICYLDSTGTLILTND